MQNEKLILATIKQYIEDVKRDCLRLKESGDLTEAGQGQMEIVEEIQKILSR